VAPLAGSSTHEGHCKSIAVLAASVSCRPGVLDWSLGRCEQTRCSSPPGLWIAAAGRFSQQRDELQHASYANTVHATIRREVPVHTIKQGVCQQCKFVQVEILCSGCRGSRLTLRVSSRRVLHAGAASAIRSTNQSVTLYTMCRRRLPAGTSAQCRLSAIQRDAQVCALDAMQAPPIIPAPLHRSFPCQKRLDAGCRTRCPAALL
jgi:hypothetical protein